MVSILKFFRKSRKDYSHMRDKWFNKLDDMEEAFTKTKDLVSNEKNPNWDLFSKLAADLSFFISLYNNLLLKEIGLELEIRGNNVEEELGKYPKEIERIVKSIKGPGSAQALLNLQKGTYPYYLHQLLGLIPQVFA